MKWCTCENQNPELNPWIFAIASGSLTIIKEFKLRWGTDISVSNIEIFKKKKKKKKLVPYIGVALPSIQMVKEVVNTRVFVTVV